MRWIPAWLVVLAALVPQAAEAHGPCGCTTPVIAEAGAELTTSRGYLVVWNPTREWFVNGAGSPSLASAHRDDAPSGVVLLRDRPPYPRMSRRARFTIPRDTPPGLYLVLVFDGSEGGQHATWDYVHVLGDTSGDSEAAQSATVHPLLRAVIEAMPTL
ncbi:MAG TPA: hypothetical protein VF587_14040 [Solirubrobacteraceae bacterium]|jgi:hypothetical protein